MTSDDDLARLLERGRREETVIVWVAGAVLAALAFLVAMLAA